MAPTPREIFDNESGRIRTPLYVDARDYLRHWMRENPSEYEEIEKLKTPAPAAPEEAAEKRMETESQETKAEVATEERPLVRNLEPISPAEVFREERARAEKARLRKENAGQMEVKPRRREAKILKYHKGRTSRKEPEPVRYQVIKTARR
jgi:hypothetical protein